MYTRLAREHDEREHDERQPYVQDDLLDALHRNNCTSYRVLHRTAKESWNGTG